jgi:hypothetical protein
MGQMDLIATCDVPDYGVVGIFAFRWWWWWVCVWGGGEVIAQVCLQEAPPLLGSTELEFSGGN